MDYRQTEGTARTWRRAHQVIVNNPRPGLPTVVFQEEDIASINGQEVRIPTMSACVGTFNPANGVIPLIHPETGESLGKSVSHAELYVILHSLYIQLAVARDEAQHDPLLPPMAPDTPQAPVEPQENEEVSDGA